MPYAAAELPLELLLELPPAALEAFAADRRDLAAAVAAHIEPLLADDEMSELLGAMWHSYEGSTLELIDAVRLVASGTAERAEG